MQYLLEAVSWRWFLVKLVRKLSQNSQGSTCAEDLFMVKGKVAVQHLTCRFAQLLNQLGPRASTIKKVWSIFYALFRSNWKNVFKACKSEKKTTLDSGLEHDKNYLTFLKPQIQTKRMNNNGNFDMLNIHEIRNSHSTWNYKSCNI